MDPEIYVYKMITDNGGAPCVWRNLLSLAICKPMIRRVADEGALIFGFGGKTHRERLLYIARVTKKPPIGDYYQESNYSRRPDCIYKNVVGTAVRKRGAVYHNNLDERKRDVGMHFERANVLLSDDFRYFGKLGTDQYKHDYPAINALVERLKRGHRVNHSATLRSELLQLQNDMWRRYRRKKLGPPTDSDRSKVCNLDTPSVLCSGR
jgi:hypothetical protein